MKPVVKIIIVAVLYALLAHITLGFFSTNGIVSVVWPPSGLALAALLLGGKRYAWAVLIGAFVANTITRMPITVALVIAVGNTLEALVAHWLLTRHGQFNLSLVSLSDYLRLIILGAGVGCVIAALLGSSALLLSGVFPYAVYAINMLHWWMGDVLGTILLTPLILVWRQLPSDWFEKQKIVEVVLLLSLTCLMGQIIFLDWFHESLGLVARGHWMFLLVSIAAMRSGTHGAVIVIVIAVFQALWGAAQGIGLFSDDISKTELTNFWFYSLILALTGMIQSTYLTEHQRIELALQESEARFRTVANAAPVLIWMSGADSLYYWFNQVWLDFTGRSLEQEAGSGWMSGIHTDDLQHYLNVYVTRFDARQAFQMEYRLKRYDGEYRWVFDFGVPRRDKHGEFLGYIGTCLDITDRKRTEANLQQFAEIAAHHLQEPLRRILSFTKQLKQQLGEASLNEKTALSLHFIEQSALRQRALVSDIQLYLAAGEPRDRNEAVDLVEVVRQVTTLYAGAMHDSGATVECEKLPLILIDKARMTDIISILLDNALLYSHPDNPPVITLSGKVKAGRLYCRFADNGIGVPVEYRQRVLGVFERLQVSKNPNSTGIGLAIVKRIIESCNGSVSLQETAGGGTIVAFDLPLY